MADMEKWSINETLLQSYRSIFVSSQSFLLAVGAIVSSKSPIVLYATAAVSFVMIWVIWSPVVRSRHRIVDYYKFASSLTPPQRATLCSEEQYVHNRGQRKVANVQFGIKTNWRPTRLKLDLWMPVLFSLVWIVLVVYQACYSR